jgi:hypothetical protein
MINACSSSSAVSWVDTALELLQAFIIKCAELMWMSSELGAKYFAGYQLSASNIG